MHGIKKIVIIGPESTGKSTLCTQLADHYQTIWCPEYAREYLLLHGANYSYEDLLVIAKGQLALEEEYTTKAIAKWEAEGRKTAFPLLFIDTDMYVMKVWCEFVFGKCHSYILDKILENKSDLYLLCNIDLPWVKDELREYPDLETRQQLYRIYKDILNSQPVPWVEISGSYEDRLRAAIDSIDSYLAL